MSVAHSPLATLHPSNALTVASLAAGLSGLVCARYDSSGGAGALIALAVILDIFDGAFARLFARTPQLREMGVHLDSLSDAVVFGTVPAACAWLLTDHESTLMLAGAVYTACAIARLAYYNVTHQAQDGFVGLPVPVAALIWSTALLLQPGAMVMTGITLLTAAAMVLPLSIPRPRREGLIVFASWPAAVCAAHIMGVMGTR